MAHFFLDESKSAGPTSILALVVMEEDARQELSKILALPDPTKFNPDAYTLLYREDGNQLKNPEYSFRRVQRAYFSNFTFTGEIRNKVDSVLNDISKLNFKILLTIYSPSLAQTIGWSQPDLKNYHTRHLILHCISEFRQDLTRNSIVNADHGFYSSKNLHLVKSSFRGTKNGVCDEGSPALRYPHLVDKKIELLASYDSKGLQLADLIAGISARTIYKPQQAEPFYSAIKDKIIILLDNRKHIPSSTGTFMQPTHPNQRYDILIRRPDLRKIKA